MFQESQLLRMQSSVKWLKCNNRKTDIKTSLFRMKINQIIILLPLFIFFSCTKSGKIQNVESINETAIINEVNQLIDTLIELTLKKDLNGVMSLYENSPNFVIIVSKEELLNYEQLKVLYINLFENMESNQLLNSEIKVYPLSNLEAYCIWSGEEEMKIKNQEPFQSAFIATMLLTYKDRKWIISKMHTSHQ